MFAFRNCISLESLNLSNIAVDNVTRFSQMFSGCSSLKNLNLSGWNTSKGTDFSGMFYGCTNLKYLDLSSWDTSAATTMAGFAQDSGLTRIKLGKSFKFVGDTNYLPQEKWKRISNGDVCSLWSEYDGNTMADTYIIENTELDLDKNNVDEISYDSENNKVTIYTDSDEGQTPTIVNFLDLFARKLKLSADLVNTSEELKSALAKNFDKTKLSLTLKNRTYADIVGCSKQKKVLWTFDIPKNNKSVIRMDLLKDKTENVGYIQNSKDALDKFTLYDKDGNAVEVLEPNARHAYKDLGYIGSYDTTETDKNGNKKVVHHDSTYYGGDIGEMTDEKLGTNIYPEYSAYLSYDSSMNNYEVPLTPGHYEIDSTLTQFTDIELAPSELITKTTDKLDEKGEPVLDNDGNKVTEEVPETYVYDNKIDISNAESSLDYFTIFNHIYQKTYNIYSSSTQISEYFRKINEYGEGVSDAVYAFTSRKTGKTYTATTRDDGIINSYMLNCNIDIGETFDVHEIKAPARYTLNPESTCVTFYKCNQDSKKLGKNDVIYDDGVSTLSKNSIMCATCQTYGQCTCKKFGDSKCFCCGKPQNQNNFDMNYATLTDYKNNSYLIVKKKVDSSVSEYDKKNTIFTFNIYDVTANKLIYASKIKADDSFVLGSPLFESKHTYKIVEETFTPSEYTPVSNKIVSSKSKNTENAEWISSAEVSNLSALSSYLDYSVASGNTYTFTYENDMSLESLPRVTFTNHHNILKHDLTVSKTVDSAIHDKVDTNKDFNFTLNLKNVTLDLADYKITYEKSDGTTDNVALDREGNFNFTLKHEQKITFKGIPDVTDYKVTEEKNYNYHVEKTNDGGRILGKNISAVFKNTEVNPGSIKLIKKDGSQKLKGVTFALAQEDGTTVATKTTDANGEVLFEDLEEGTYTVKETKTVKGHSLLSEPFKVTIPFTIKKDKATEKKVDTSKAVLMGDTYYFYDLTYTIDNGKTLNLPNTGLDKQSYLWVTLAIAATISIQYWLATKKRRARKRNKH